MNWKKKLLRNSRLYAIIDRDTCPDKDIFRIVSKIKNKGVDIFQLRDKSSSKKDIYKSALRLKKMLSGLRCIFIINDHLDVALAVDADGLHLGQEDLPFVQARKILGKDKIIGISCHNLSEAISAQKNDADYIGLGPIFPTPFKANYPALGINKLRLIRKKVSLPIFAIGGINQINLSEVLSVDRLGIALCREICLAENPQKIIERLKDKLCLHR